ncbi:MAG: hypothetical protein CM15mP123_10950 [Gammaproteobacteria bacterium]|nr:MAG: hypothetical protein CM15mP123_10950 [Gammaproteobacteria bacterium]
MFLRKFLFFVTLSTFVTFGFSQIETVSVNSKGYGDGPESALNSALTQAIGQVNGRSIDSDSLLTTTEKTSTKNDESDYLSSRDFKESIKSKTKGVVESYSILSNAKDDSGLWVAEITAQIARFKTSKSANRKRIAVIDLIGRQGCCLTVEGELNPDVAAYEVSSAISNFLVQSRKFTVLDRSFQGFAETERNTLKTSENMPVKELAKLGQELFADMILVGNLNSIRLQKAQRKMNTSDRVLEYLTGNIATNIRIIDTATGQIKFSSSLRMNPKDLDLNLGSDIFTISKKVGERVGFTVLNAIYPIQVTGVTEKIVVDLNTGGDVVSVGQVFDLMLLGEKIKDAYTKESLGKRETKIGTVEITQVSPKQSRGKATLINETSNLETNFKPKMYILRLSNSSKKQALKKKTKEVRKQIEKDFEDLY